MAEIGTASALVSLVTAALQSSITLYRTIKSLQNRERLVRDLRNELQDLEYVLRTLEESITATAVDIKALERPLNRCSRACEEFNALIIECTRHSTNDRTSKRDWLKLQYLGDDIAGFRNMLAGYKSTVVIALAHANMYVLSLAIPAFGLPILTDINGGSIFFSRTTAITTQVLDEYRELIEHTKFDLEAHLQDIKARLQVSTTPDNGDGGSSCELDSAELRRVQDEKESTLQCLKICDEFSLSLDNLRQTSLESTARPAETPRPTLPFEQPSLPWLMVTEAFNSAQYDLVRTKRRLHQHLHGLSLQLQAPHHRLLLPPPIKQINEQQNFEEEVYSIEGSLSLCNSAEKQEKEIRRNYFEDVISGDDGKQIIVSTLKELISAKRIKTGNRSVQIMGQMSDESLQHLGAKTDNRNGEEAE
jgi:hypothetical protein